MSRLLLIFTILFSISGFKSQVFTGEVYLRDHSKLYLNQIYVTNLSTQKTVLSLYDGTFRINAKTGDQIRFTSIVTERKDIQVTKEMLEKGNYLFELKIAYHEIEEVVISSFKPTGNLRKDVLSLKKGNKGDEVKKMIGLPEPKGDGTSPELPVADFRDGGLTFSLESIYDILSGERKKKQRLREYEKMMTAVNGIQNYFGDDYFKSLGIPSNYIPNFLQFVYTSDYIWMYVENGNYEATQHYIEKYLPIYLRRLKNSSLMEVVEK